jgi:ribonuclease HI
MKTWARNNWMNTKKRTVENLDLVKELYNYLNIPFFNCQVVKCKGHMGEVQNELADALATNNATKWKQLIDCHNIIDNVSIY